MTLDILVPSSAYSLFRSCRMPSDLNSSLSLGYLCQFQGSLYSSLNFETWFRLFFSRGSASFWWILFSRSLLLSEIRISWACWALLFNQGLLVSDELFLNFEKSEAELVSQQACPSLADSSSSCALRPCRRSLRLNHFLIGTVWRRHFSADQVGRLFSLPGCLCSATSAEMSH